MRERKVQLKDTMSLIREKLNEGHEVTFSPRGTSMLPFLRDGLDSVTLTLPKGKLKKYDVAFYQRRNGQYVLHRVVRVGKTYTCVGDNQFVFENGIEQDQIIGVCSLFVRKGKTIKANSLLHRAYAVFWHYSRFGRRVFFFLYRRGRRLFKSEKEMKGNSKDE